MQVECLEQQERKEQRGLVPRQPGRRASPRGCLGRVEHENAGQHVRISLEVVRVGVMGVVLVDPPAVAESVQQVGVQQAEQPGR